MSHFLFAVEIPPVPESSFGTPVAPAWIQFCKEADMILKPLKTCTIHQKNVFLLPVENGFPVLLALSSKAEEHTLSYSVLLVESVTDLSDCYTFN